jgi:hypothetical protein
MAGYPRLLYLNRVGASTTTITASAADSGYPDDNLGDWREYLPWAASGANSYTVDFNLGSALACTAFAIVGHNLNTCGARYKLEAGSNGVDFATAVVAYQTPGNNRTVAHYFANPDKRYYRLTIDNNGGANFSPSIGIAFLGSYLEMERLPETPLDPDAIEDVYEDQTGETGYLLGTLHDHTLRRTSWSFKALSQTWITATWLPFIRSYRLYPFLFAWDYETESAGVYLVKFSNTTHGAPFMDIYRELTFDLVGRFEA